MCFAVKGYYSRVHLGPYIVLQLQFLEGNGDLERVGGALTIEHNVVLLRAHGGEGEEAIGIVYRQVQSYAAFKLLRRKLVVRLKALINLLLTNCSFSVMVVLASYLYSCRPLRSCTSCESDGHT